MGITVKVDINAADIARKAVTPALRTYANARFYAHMYDYIPFRDGMLSANVTVTEECVHFISPYAARMYTGDRYNFRKDHHPLACARWDRPAWAANGKQIIAEIEAAYKYGDAFMMQAVAMERGTIEQRKQEAGANGQK